MNIKQNFAVIQEKIERVCEKVGRDPNEVTIVTVTKYVSLETTKAAMDAGLIHIGENRTDEAVAKWDALDEKGVWHFIGTLQSRKVREVINTMDYLHSLDRMSLVKEVDKRLEEGKKMKCFVQVNVSGEKTKSGVTPDELIPFIKSIEPYEGIEVVGLMTMAPHYDDPELTRPVFKELRQLRDEVKSLQLPYAPCTHLSMGMSNDYEVALEEGATFIRIGSALVGNELRK